MSLETGLLALRFALAALFYLFLAGAFWAIWKEIASTARQGEIKGYLRVLKGDGAGLLRGELLPLETNTTLGRKRDNSIVVGDKFASAHHALLTMRDEVWWLTDLGSQNGTTLNDLPISEAVPLVVSDVIGIGRVSLQLVDKAACPDGGEQDGL